MRICTPFSAFALDCAYRELKVTLDIIQICKVLQFSAAETWSIVTHEYMWNAMSSKFHVIVCVCVTQLEDVPDSK